ncbi:MAG: AAA family ATPase, partial [Chloroflexota bacterium]|nr:AAA family ATPase [Chloroflexota bacterium]
MQAPFADPLSGLEQLYTPLPLVGRETELRLMRALLYTVASNLPVGARAVTISGAMGIGKSRFLAEIYQEASAQGFRVIQGHTYEAARMFPYLPFIEALRPILLSATPEQLRSYVGLTPASPPILHEQVERFSSEERQVNLLSLVGTPLVAALAQLFPTLPKMLHVFIEPELLSPDQQKFRLLDAIATILERMAEEQPILLGIDNLQWADSASLELMMYLTVRLHSSRVALVGVTRLAGTHSTSHEQLDTGTQDASMAAKASMMAAKVIGDLMRRGLLLLLPLGPLGEDAALQHIHALLPGSLSDTVIQSLLKRAEGNLFFLEELVRMLTGNRSLILREGAWQATKTFSAELPTSITVSVQERLSELSTDCRFLLRVASLFGRTFPFYALIEVLAETEESVLPRINEAVQAGIIARTSLSEARWETIGENAGDENRACMFCQSIVYEIVRAEVSRQRSRFLHGKIGAVLEAGYGDEAPAHAAELARHYVLSDQKAAALHWSLLAGKEAARQQAHREAITHFLQALKFHETGNVSDTMFSSIDVYLAIGESWFKLGELEQAANAFQQALENQNVAVEVSPGDRVSLVGAVESSPLQIAQANRQLADVYRLQARYDLALAHLQIARTALEQLPEESANNGKAEDETKTSRPFPG